MELLELGERLVHPPRRLQSVGCVASRAQVLMQIYQILYPALIVAQLGELRGSLVHPP